MVIFAYMEYFVVGTVALLASLLTFFSGFGLGTMLMPVFALFFLVEEAIAVTGIVHLLNNLFKLGLIGRNINGNVLLRFGLPAIVGAFLGAGILIGLSHTATLFEGVLLGFDVKIEGINLVIGLVLIGFALYDLLPGWREKSFGENYLIPGGVISGFFGGLSGHQGALRSAFLIKLGLSKEAYIATGVSIACLVDLARIPLYSGHILNLEETPYTLLSVAILSAFLGAYFGKKFLRKISLPLLHQIVAYMMMIIAAGLITGIV